MTERVEDMNEARAKKAGGQQLVSHKMLCVGDELSIESSLPGQGWTNTFNRENFERFVAHARLCMSWDAPTDLKDLAAVLTEANQMPEVDELHDELELQRTMLEQKTTALDTARATIKDLRAKRAKAQSDHDFLVTEQHHAAKKKTK